MSSIPPSTIPGVRMDRSFAWSVAAFSLSLLVTVSLTGAYLRDMFRYRAAVEEAATEVTGVLLRDLFDVVDARSTRGAGETFRAAVALARSAESLEDIESVADVLARTVDSLAACADCSRVPITGVAVLDPIRGSLSTRGGDTTVWRSRLEAATSARAGEADWILTATGVDEAGPWVHYVIRTTRSGLPPLILAAEVDLEGFASEIIEPSYTWALGTHDLTRELRPDAVALLVGHADGLVLVDEGRHSDGPSYTLPLFSEDLNSLDAPVAEPITARLSIDPAALAPIIPGGIPASPLPLVVGSALLALTLTVVGVTLLLRMRRFALTREHFIGTVSHELRTPLSLMLAYGETVGMDRPTPESRRRAATVIVRETRRMIHLVENALAFSRGQSSTAALDPRPTDVGAAVRSIAADFEPLAAGRDVSIAVRATSAVWARVDAGALRQMVNNLLDNAVRHGPEGQTVTVTVQARGDWMELQVADHGPGLPPGDPRRIWQAFARGSEESSGAGTGLGLSIVRHLVELHAGEVTAGRGPRGGAVFTVRLPAANPGEAP